MCNSLVAPLKQGAVNATKNKEFKSYRPGFREGSHIYEMKNVENGR